MSRRIIEIETSEVHEAILQILTRHPAGISSEKLRYILEGKTIPLTPFQIRTILQEMVTLTLIGRERRSRSFVYLLVSPQELEFH